MSVVESIATILLCGILPVVLVVLSAIWGTEARFRLAKRIFRLRSEGYYDNWSRRPIASKIRFLSASGLATTCCLMIAVAIAILDPPVFFTKVGLSIFATLLVAEAIIGLIWYKIVLANK